MPHPTDPDSQPDKTPDSLKDNQQVPSTAQRLEDDAPWISDDLIPDVLDGNQNQAVLGSIAPSELSPTLKRPDIGDRPKQHSAELFPIPPLHTTEATAASVEDVATNTESVTANSSGDGGSSGDAVSVSRFGPGPLPLVETAFLASAASLMWLVNTYFPPGPLLRILFPLPIALVYLRWNARSAWMAATVSGLLLTILLGPTRSIFFVMPYGLLGVQLGCLWRRKANWNVSILTGGLLVALGSFFRVWLLSLLAGEDLWGYSIAQITQLLSWAIRNLTNWGLIGLGSLGQPGLGFVSVAAVVMVVFASMVYLFTVHLAAWLLLERLGVDMPEPPSWVQVLIEE